MHIVTQASLSPAPFRIAHVQLHVLVHPLDVLAGRSMHARLYIQSLLSSAAISLHYLLFLQATQ
jgi:hypothetical protein